MQLTKEMYFSMTYMMKHALYNLLIKVSQGVLWPSQFFSPKMKLFIQGRKDTFKTLDAQIGPNDKTLWFHCASLGEYEQGLPIMEALKKEKPEHKIVLTFFSPSGYEVKKNTPMADVVTYLPLDTLKNSRTFIKKVHPTMAFFVKYEFWPNYLFELKRQNIPAILVSGVFRSDQSFFKRGASFMRKSLDTFQHFFVQNEDSLELLKSIQLNNASISGDTRFDRVSHQIEMDNTLPFMEEFKGHALCVVCGSTWPEDEEVLTQSLQSEYNQPVKFIIAPHNINPKQIASFRNKIGQPSILYSEKDRQDLASAKVLIIDTIGLLSKIYSYADIAYVGGAMGTTGLHNILEPATFGVPIIVGKEISKFPEAIKLEDIAGLYSISNAKECHELILKMVKDKKFREQTGMICGHFVNKNTGATRVIMDFVRSYL